MVTYKLLKFKNGETMVCRIEMESEDVNVDTMQYVNVWNPVAVVVLSMIPTREGYGERYLLKPWMPLSPDEVFTINTESLITICNVNGHILENYLNFQNRTIQDFHASQVQENPATEEKLEEFENDIMQELLSNLNETKRVIH
jgi:hypothetical protein